MPRTRPPYPPEFREQMVELVKAGRTPEELSREFEPTAQTIHNWVKQADLDTGVRSDGLTSSEREELRVIIYLPHGQGDDSMRACGNSTRSSVPKRYWPWA